MKVNASDFHIGKIIRILRANKMPQYKFSEKLGITNKHLSNLETGKIKPNWNMLCKILNEVDAELIIRTENIEFNVFIDKWDGKTAIYGNTPISTMLNK